jgi:hypothetical protein
VRFIKGFGKFWYDFIVGDDWKVAAAVVLGLSLTAGAMLSGVLRGPALTVAGGSALVLLFMASVIIDVRRRP